MNSQLKYKIILGWIKIINPAQLRKITKSERYVILTALKVIKKKNTELLLHPNEDEFYIDAKDDNIFICCHFNKNYNTGLVTIVNHKFSYDVKFNSRAFNILYIAFNEEIAKRRDKLKQQYLNNSEHSLRVVYNNII